MPRPPQVLVEPPPPPPPPGGLSDAEKDAVREGRDYVLNKLQDENPRDLSYNRDYLRDAALEAQGSQSWRRKDYIKMAEGKMANVKNDADYQIGEIRNDIQKTQKQIDEAELTVAAWRKAKDSDLHYDEDLVNYALDQQRQAQAKLERLKARLQQVEFAKKRSIYEIQKLRDGAQQGDYSSYWKLREYGTYKYPSAPVQKLPDLPPDMIQNLSPDTIFE
jgi:hypothetical protein